MRKYKLFNYLIVGVTVFASYSCNKILDYQSPSALNIEQTFANPDNTNNEIIGIYNKAAGRSAFGSNLSYTIPAGGDDFSAKGAASFDPTSTYAISNFGANGLNRTLEDAFNQLYAGIERANIAIKYIPLSAAYKSSDRLTMQRYLGEALTLRALFYYELIINWGDVPATFVPAADLKDQFIRNSNRDSTYDKILDDLKEAEGYIGWRSQLPTYGTFRLTKAAVKALRARIALARGGYSLRSDSHKMERRADYEKYYQIAFDECNDIIESGEHQLNPVYENIFKTLHSNTRYDNTNEIIFEIAMWGGMNDSDLARSYGTMFNGSPTWGKAGGGPNGLPTYFYEFENGKDVRRDVTLSTYIVGANEMKSLNGLTGMSCGKFRKSWTSFTSESTMLTFGVNWPVVRYADVLLMFAEAGNELQKSGIISPLDALQLVQHRAFGANDIPAAPIGKAAFFDSVVRERKLEFGGEGLRKYDLIRWNLLADKINDVKSKLPYLTAGVPLDNNPYSYVPDYVYIKPTKFGNLDCTSEESNIEMYGGTNNEVFYKANTAVPAGYTRIYWKAQLGIYYDGALTKDQFINDPNAGYASKFVENKSELLPYPQKVLIENRGAIVQNYGYEQ